MLSGSDWDANLSAMAQPKSDTDLMQLLAKWDSDGCLVCGGTPGTSDTNAQDGIVDNHAYSLLAVELNVAATGMNFLLLRNPHGRTEFEGGWRDTDQRWETASGQKVRAALEENYGRIPVADDGLFWMESTDAFKYIPNWTVCLSGQKRVREDKPAPVLQRQNSPRLRSLTQTANF